MASKIIKFREVSKIMRPNQEIVEILEELLDLAKCGSMQQLSYVFLTQEGDSGKDNLGYIEGFEEHFLGLILRNASGYEDILDELDYEDED